MKKGVGALLCWLCAVSCILFLLLLRALCGAEIHTSPIQCVTGAATQCVTGGSQRRAWGGRHQVCWQEVLPGATTDPHVAAHKGPIEKGHGGRAAVRVEVHDSSLLRPGNL